MSWRPNGPRQAVRRSTDINGGRRYPQVRSSMDGALSSIGKMQSALRRFHVAIVDVSMKENKYDLIDGAGEIAKARGLVSAEWYKCEVPRSTMRELMKRSNWPALRDTFIWYGLIATAGVLAYWSVGTVWAVPAFFLYGTLYAGPADSRWHDAGHGTPFRSAWMNETLYQLASFQVMRRPTVWRWSHVRHHSDTLITGRDPEIQVQLPIQPLAVVADFIGLKLAPTEFVKAIANAVGYQFATELTFLPASELLKTRREALAWLGIFALIATASVYWQTWLPALFVGLPSIYGAWLYNFFGVTQHAALPENVLDYRLNSRTVLMNPMFRFLYWNMNYHVEHHMFPTVPYHALPKLHATIRDDCPAPYGSTWAAYKELLPAIVRQWKDPTYHVLRPLPPVKTQGT